MNNKIQDNVSRAKLLFPELCNQFSETALQILLNEDTCKGEMNEILHLTLAEASEHTSKEQAAKDLAMTWEEIEQEFEVIELVDSKSVILVNKD